MARIAINGLGRIGRATLKLVMEEPSLELIGVNDLADHEQLAYLLRYDSVYGRSTHEVASQDGQLVIDGQHIPLSNHEDPLLSPWKDLDVDLVFECTGAFRDRDALQRHLEAGARKVMLSAPAKDESIPMIVPGVNDAGTAPIFSCASCTTNCIAPVTEVMQRRIGVAKAMMTTVHAYTSTQETVDAPSKRMERGRAAAINLVPTSTGAAEATNRVLGEHPIEFDGLAVRAPVAVGSLADITFVTSRATSREEVNKVFMEESLNPRYSKVLSIIEEPIVSSDVIQDAHASIVDLGLTRVVDGDLVKVMAWYDNEWGYAAQMVREAARLYQ
ncbi:type I glyceraldehyde-3-phosphate dehydrogenase [Lamprobacter modestohalophilus]|uniref:Type I glyceraldehyde-3-phosphate dehydrogenase n=1 Tax=Lamprobacter modestohalophilus TaxID=1064514 RepID=A0A9X0W972_9GAMM|nr:glyceraldehyde 3-phosphate dehydrogenase NAD-binding domain-containing protein [Lamprobacter modestohalophilus]MBK1619298.1 type I glyceraldehyde-3-phosphate dehydrogenase [Lamprobacter modestohalophilus]